VYPDPVAFSQRAAFGLCAAALIAAVVLAWPRGSDAPAPDAGTRGAAEHGEEGAPVDVAHGGGAPEEHGGEHGGDRTAVPADAPKVIALVVDAQERPAADVEVVCTAAGGAGVAQLTDREGRAVFALPRARPGDAVRLRVDGIGCDGASAELPFADASTVPVRLRLAPAGFLSVHVVHADGSEVGDLLAAGYAVAAQLSDGARGTRRLDARGRVRLGPLALGKAWALLLEPALAQPLAVRGPTADEPYLGVELALPADLVIATGLVQDADGRPVTAPVVVELQAPKRWRRAPAAVDATGRFTAALGDVAADQPVPVAVELANDAERAALQWVTLRPGRCELGTFTLAAMPVLLSGRVLVDGAPAAGEHCCDLEVLPAPGAERATAAGPRAVAVEGGEDGAFAARGLFRPGDRVRVQPANGFVVDTTEFAAGAHGVDLRLRRLAKLTATVVCADPSWHNLLDTLLVCPEPLAMLPAERPAGGAAGAQQWLGPEGGTYELQVRVRATGEIVGLRGGVVIEAPHLSRSRDLGELPVENLRALRVEWPADPRGLHVLARLPEHQWLALGAAPLLHKEALELLAGGPEFWIEPPPVVGDAVRPAPRRVQPTLFRLPAELSLQPGEKGIVACTYAGEFDPRALSLLAPAPKGAVDEHGVAAVPLPMAGDWHVQATIERPGEPPIRVALPLLKESVTIDSPNGRDVVLECDPEQLEVRLRSLRK
jgi:hypothetical protein